MKVIIPLAGKGTRVRPHTYATPKPLLPVGGKPVMSYILDELKELGVTEIVFITGYLKEEIEAYIGREYPEFKSHYIEQPIQNGTAGAVVLAEEYIDEDVLIIFVDTVFDADLTVINRLPDVAGVIWAKEVEDYQRFGVILNDAEGYMKRIVEKPKDPISKLANIGLYYIRDWKLFFEGVNDTMKGTRGKGGEYYITDAFQYMIDRGAKIKTVEVDGWYDAGKPDTILSTNRHLLEAGRAKRPLGGAGVKLHDPIRVEDGSNLEHSEIGPNVSIGKDAVVRNSRLRDTIIGDGCEIVDADLHDSIIGNNVKVRGFKGSVSVTHHSELIGDD